jgi:hypothetical protein
MNERAKSIAMRAQAPLPLEGVPEDRAPTLLSIIADAASNPNCDVDKMRALLEMRRELERDEAKRAYAAAMNMVQEKIKPIAADAANPQTKSKYASYFALDKELRPIYTAHGFSLNFNTDNCPLPDHVRVVCDVSHNGGHSCRHQIDMPADGKGAKGGDVMTKTHAMGSAITYGKRYLLGMIFNIAVAQDDDGNAAGNTLISPEQRDELVAIADERGVDKAAFCRRYKIASLADISVANFAKAKSALLSFPVDR